MSTNPNIINYHQRDAAIHFEEQSHTYTHNGLIFTSVTTIIERYFEQFDADYWANRKAKSMGMTPEQVKRLWQENGEVARNLGSMLHNKIERYYLGLPNDDDPSYCLFQDFTKDFTLSPYRTEWAIYDEEYCVAGTLDFLNFKDGVFEIYDWKRSNKLVVNGKIEKCNKWGKCAFDPISHIHDTTYWHYALQVSMYRFILEKNYGISISQSRLAVFHPDCGRYHVIDMPYLKDEVQSLLQDHLQVISKNARS